MDSSVDNNPNNETMLLFKDKIASSNLQNLRSKQHPEAAVRRCSIKNFSRLSGVFRGYKRKALARNW